MSVYKDKEEEKSFIFFQLQLSKVLSPTPFFLYTLFKNKSKSNTEKGNTLPCKLK